MIHHPNVPQPGGEDAAREVLRLWEHRRAPEAPTFESVHRRIATTPSPLAQPRWSPAHSLRLAGALTRAQLRVVPWLVIPVALISGTVAVLVARYIASVQDASTAVASFSSIVLVGVALTMAMALSTTRADAVSLAMPLGPQSVVFARVTAVLVANAVSALVASVIIFAWGVTGSLAAMVTGWLVPLALIAALSTFVTIWVAPWAGAILGVVIIPLASPHAASSLNVGLGALAHAIQDALTPVGVVLLGLGLLAFAIASARRALVTRSANGADQA